MSSIKKNAVLNMIYTVSGILFPLIAFRYASRILLADGIGQVYFFTSLIEYIILLTSLGIPLYAIREIARVRDDHALMSKTATEILILHSVLSAAGYLAVFLLICTVTKIQADIPLFLLLSVSILFKAIGVEWFYNGVEDFKYITVRSIIVRTVSLLALFIFVKEKEDLFYYAAISVAGTVGNNLFNFFRLPGYVNIYSFGWKDLHVWRHLNPALKIFALNLIISLYINLDSIMLGFLKDETAVGYYAASTRISKTLVGLVGALGPVLLPRLSSLAIRNSQEEFWSLADKSLRFIVAFSLPMTVGVFFMASPIIHLFCGSDFEPSVLTLQIMSPVILFISVSGLYCMQILYSMGKEKLAIFSASLGALVNLTLNFCLIPVYSQYGAGVATVVAELAVIVCTVITGRKYIPVHFFFGKKIHYCIATLLVITFLLLLKLFRMNEISYLITGTVVSATVYYTYLMLVKDEIILQVTKSCIKTIKSFM
ncbi:MAG: flippase [Tannerella sp.]|jgi:O-antigen/teichoic acid export membrane protein|nr:flippase [Tannerella sp.]